MSAPSPQETLDTGWEWLSYSNDSLTMKNILHMIFIGGTFDTVSWTIALSLL